VAKEVELARRFWDKREAVITVRTILGMVVTDSGVFAIEGVPIYHAWWMLGLLLLIYPGIWSWRKLHARAKELRGY
jgi:hypothetical protein